MNTQEVENKDDNAHDFSSPVQVLLSASSSLILNYFNFLMSFLVPKVTSILTVIMETDRKILLLTSFGSRERKTRHQLFPVRGCPPTPPLWRTVLTTSVVITTTSY
jgi:hypothetical protein